MDRLKKKITIRAFFIRYMLWLGAGVILLTAFMLLLLLLLSAKGVIQPSNYEEKWLEANRDVIETVKNVKEILPKGCLYGIYDEKGQFLEGTILQSEREGVWKAKQNQDNQAAGGYLKSFQRRNDELCIVVYQLRVKFVNPVIEKIFPGVEITAAMFFVCLLLILILTVAKSFGKALSADMNILDETARNVLKGELDYEERYLRFQETDHVNSSLNILKRELEYSLKTQWETERARREQISALGHDLKTPLTILRGNAELMEELNTEEELQMYLKNILGSADDMQEYLQMLLMLNKMDTTITEEQSIFDLNRWSQDILIQARSLCLKKEILLKENVCLVEKELRGNRAELIRAVMNLISNAVEYTPEKGTLSLSIHTEGEFVIVETEDSGKGFTNEELKMARHRFYQGDKSRSSRDHFGMGLFIADSIAKAHRGELIMENSNKFSGARCVLKFGQVQTKDRRNMK